MCNILHIQYSVQYKLFFILIHASPSEQNLPISPFLICNIVFLGLQSNEKFCVIMLFLRNLKTISYANINAHKRVYNILSYF